MTKTIFSYKNGKTNQQRAKLYRQDTDSQILKSTHMFNMTILDITVHSKEK